MSFFDKFTKGVGKAAEQAKFEADKLMRVNRVGAEVSELATQTQKATADIGTKVMDLRAAGKLQLPELDEMVRHVESLQTQLAAKQAELEKVRMEKFEVPSAPQPAAPPAEVSPAPAPTPVPTAAAPATEATGPVPEAPPAPKLCPACGAPAESGSKFCPSCGQKLG